MIDQIKDVAPNSWKELLSFYKKETENFPVKEYDFLSLPFIMQAGIFIKFFEDNGFGLDLANFSFDELPEQVYNASIELEKVLKHYS